MRLPDPEPATVAAGVPVAIHPDLLARCLDRDLRLAQTGDPVEQFRVMADLTSDLGREVLRLARGGSLEPLPLLSGLYEHAACRGLVDRARAVPAARRGNLVGPVLRQLRETEAEVEREAAHSKPGLEWGLRPVGGAARSAAQALAARAPLPPLERQPGAEESPGSERALLAVLVTQGVRMAEKDDPLRRADCCNEVAFHLSRVMLTASPRGEGEQAARLGRYLGDYMDQAVKGNLGRVRLDKPDDPRLEELEQVMRRSDRILKACEQNLARHHGPGRPDLHRMRQGPHGRRFKEARVP